MVTRVIRRRFHWTTIILTTLVCGGVVLATALVLWSTHPKAQIPANVKVEVHFPIFYPAQFVIVDSMSYKYDPPSGVLSFIGRAADGQIFTFAEQATPDPINDIPGFYDKFLTAMFEYTAFDSLQGTVHLTHPNGAGQAAVMNAKGTLMFVRVDHDESKSTWQQIFSSLQLYNS